MWLYVGCDNRWVDPADGVAYRVRIAFQVRIHPSAYGIGQETVGATRRGETIDASGTFPNTSVEWYTDTKGTIFLTGLVVDCLPAGPD